jgi:glycosyltransferase involved in cell wall biosynthesis
MSALVSVIVPAYNREALVEETLESIRRQSYRDRETLIVDDGSSDGTAQVVRTWLVHHSDARGKLLTMKKNSGKSAAVNAGVAESRGEYIAILDSDDLLEPDTLARQVAFLEKHPECGMVFGLARMLEKDGSVGHLEGGIGLNRDSLDFVGDAGDLLLRVNPIVSSSVLMRRSAVIQVGVLNDRLRYVHDWEYWIRLSGICKIGFLHAPLVRYRVSSPNSSSANRIGTFKEVAALLELRKTASRTGRLGSLMRHVRFYMLLSLRDGRFLDAVRILALGCLHTVKVIFR